MSNEMHAVIFSALITELLERFAGPMLAADAACRRAASNPGLARAQETLSNWLAKLADGDHDAAFAPEQLEGALRALLVRALSRGSVEVGDAAVMRGPVFILAPEDVAPLEIVREIARILDTADGTRIISSFDAYQDATLERIVALTAGAVTAHN